MIGPPPDSTKTQPKVTLVLAGGGIRSVSCIPLFKFLHDNQIEIEHIYGTSGGAIMGCCLGMGLKADEIADAVKKLWRKELFQKLNHRALLGIAGLPFGEYNETSAVLNAHRIQKTLSDFFGDTLLEDLSPIVHVHTTNFKTGQGLTLSKGLVSKATYASSADFPFLPPIEINGQWLVDGAFSSPLPILPALKNSRPQVIIAMMYDVIEVNPQNLVEAYYAFFSHVLAGMRHTQIGFGLNMYTTEVIFIRVKCRGMIKMWDVEKIPEIMECATAEIEMQKEEILKAILDAKPGIKEF